MNAPSQPRQLRIALVDDEEAVRTSLTALLEGTPDLACAGCYASVEAALAGLAGRPADVLLLDLRMPGTGGIQGIPRFQRAFPDLHVVILTLFHEDDEIFAALRAGAIGYLLKRDPPEMLLQSLRDASSGGSPMSPAIARRVIQSFRSQPAAREDSELTRQELRILELLRSGRTYKQAAAELDISLDTVRTHVKRIYRKLQVNSLVQALGRTEGKDSPGLPPRSGGA